ncbi:hypothetical protein L484_021094 [Morus notabilis]|uniref:DUF1664 domain-containing protein n=1 Tax=Morus notabilis TaxID=981085 RepID=W9RPW3_9ROSA|nr:hypothetical protein L484_021094 [Morus notabilis]
MAMQSGIGLSKILVLAGVGYTSTIVLKNNKISDLLGELQRIVQGIESREKSESDSDHSDVLVAQVRRMSEELRRIASNRQITVLNGGDGYGNLTSLVGPVAAVGALGYAYMWWKGISFSDLMYVTKRNMATAVSNLTKHLENVSDALAKTKQHLTQRIQNLDDKMLEQNELSRAIKDDVAGVHQSLSEIDYDLSTLQRMNGKICTLEEKQDLANLGVFYLCNFVDGRKMKMPEELQEQFKLSGKSRGLLTGSDTPSLMGLKEIADSLSGGIGKSASDVIAQDSIDKTEEKPRNLLRFGLRNT